MKTPLLIFILLFTFQICIQADVRFVSKSGSSEPPYLTWETASDSIQKCLDICDNGDTVYVGNGVYKESLIINKEIVFLGSSMDSTVIDGRGLTYYTIDINELSKTQIENFTIYGFMPHDGWAVRTYSALNIKACKIDGCAAGVGTIAVPCIMTEVIIRHALLGFRGGCFPDTCNYFLSDNIIALDTSTSLSPAYGINTGLGGNYSISNNLIIFTGINPGNGVSFGWVKKAHMSNNIISGFTANIYTDLIDTLFVTNNLLIGRKNLFNILSSGDHIIVKNTILTRADEAIWGDSRVISNYNIYWNNKLDLNGVSYGDSDQVADPMFVIDTVPDTSFSFDFHLQAFSPGIDKGDPSILDADGSRSDIGPYGGPHGETYTYQDLKPRAPVNLTATVTNDKIILKWNKNSEADTGHYSVYMDSTADFLIDSTKLLAATNTNLFTYLNPQFNKYYYFKLTATDKQGNVSDPSEELHLFITYADEGNYPIEITDYMLYQNYPNPFNPETKIRYRLKDRGYVKLLAYDIKGELIRVLVNKEQEAGYYETSFDGKGLASGIYLYRIEVIGKGSIPIYSEMKKTILLK